MKYLKLTNHKLIFILLAIAYLLLIYREPIITYLTFDLNAADLGGIENATYIRNRMLLSDLKLQVSMFQLSFYKAFIFPLIIAFVANAYAKLKDNFVKLNIGKNSLYNHELLKLKLELALVPTLIYSFAFLAIIFVAILMGDAEFVLDSDINLLFAESSILHSICTNTIIYLVCHYLLTVAAIYINALFCFKLVDVFKNPLRVSIIYLVFIWILSIIMYNVIGLVIDDVRFITPLSTMMLTSYGWITIPKIIMSYGLYILFYILMKVYPYEI